MERAVDDAARSTPVVVSGEDRSREEEDPTGADEDQNGEEEDPSASSRHRTTFLFTTLERSPSSSPGQRIG